MRVAQDLQQYRTARLSRDARFDGAFFVAVKTTGIFCRPICPAKLPKEDNVEYFDHAPAAIQAGYRPCLRCRPDSAPESWAWKGTETSFQRGRALVEAGALNQGNIEDLCQRLGISSRYFRQLFQTHLGMSPKMYSQYHQLMFAKQLLHDSHLAIGEVAYACGFNSVRRFNDAFKKYLHLTPTQVRKQLSVQPRQNVLYLSYRGDFAWEWLLNFYQLRAIEGVESVDSESYQRFVDLEGDLAWFRISKNRLKNKSIKVEFKLDDATKLYSLIDKIKSLFDINADTQHIEAHLVAQDKKIVRIPGIRVPGVWSVWEAGVRAILGQQVSVKAAIGQLNLLCQTLNYSLSQQLVFPPPDLLANADLSFLRMPEQRKQTLKRFAQYMCQSESLDIEDWLNIKGIGPWTVNYVRMRAGHDPDVFLDGDLVVKKYLTQHLTNAQANFSPWGSYATLHCWSHY
ncbi:DNA-3-methyladenine glycosylase 2 family protein [Vibrio hippocampi]|uniref:Bifunctional transcriptional activator/DNA repair enzyme AlkA n=1 Tax=Vibrio hippocampi TaxID=654686 RepID=A0ABN8DN37_9VIBR|nr:Ada metal-binding domain-containing protein [Vibrio hippocampi]CAH0528736.1 putative bifunctional transcriptional activator/DNA repair enzyme AlkA [Vibrio hippocampi]